MSEDQTHGDQNDHSNDPFDRQRSVDGWDQQKIQSQSVLLLGVGGIGCSIATALCRLGVKKVYKIDSYLGL